MSRDRAIRRKQATVLAKAEPETMRALLKPHVREFCDELLWDLRNRIMKLNRDDGWAEVLNPAHRTAMDVIPRITHDIGESQTLVINLLQAAGATDESHLLAMVQRVKSADGVTLDQARRSAIEVLKLAMRDDPGCCSEIESALFGRRGDASSAMVLET